MAKYKLRRESVPRRGIRDDDSRGGVPPGNGGVPASSDKKDAFLLALVFCLAFALRLVYLLQARESPFFIPFDRMLDPFIYDTWAQRIAGGDWLGTGVFQAMPLYPYLLGVIYRVFGRDVFLAMLFQSIIGSATCLLVYAIARRLFDRWIAFIAGLCAACYAVFIFYGGMLAGTTLTVFLTTLATI